MFRSPLLLVLAVLMAATVVALLLFRESGSKQSTATRPGAPSETSSAEQNLVPFAEFKGIPLDAPRATIEGQFGKPLRSAPAGVLDPGANCLFYRAPADAAPATEYQFCFIGGKLHSKYAG